MQNPITWHCLGMHEDVKNGNIVVWHYTKGKTPRYWGRWIDSPSQGIHETLTLQFPQVLWINFLPLGGQGKLSVSSLWSVKLSTFLTQLMHFNVVHVSIVEWGGGATTGNNSKLGARGEGFVITNSMVTGVSSFCPLMPHKLEMMFGNSPQLNYSSRIGLYYTWLVFGHCYGFPPIKWLRGLVHVR